MPRICSVCSHQSTAEVSKAIARGDSNQTIADRYSVMKSAVQRHRVNCMRQPRKQKPGEADAGNSGLTHQSASLADSVRFDSKDPSSLVAATAKLVDEALGLLEHAKKGDDRKTALAALREARDGLQLLMRVAGMLVEGGATNIDARRQTVQIFAKLSEDELKALAYGQPIPALSAGADAREVIDATEESQARQIAS